MLVSVVIPAFNAASCLKRAVQSVLGQTIRDLEIIIIDDCSQDQTVALIERLAAQDERIRVFKNAKNVGVSATRNRGFDEARGDWIAILDADDAFCCERLDALISIGVEEEADLVADNMKYYDWEAKKVTGSAINSLEPSERRIISTEYFLRNCITGRSAFDFGQLKIVGRREFFNKQKLRYIEGLRHGEDFMLYVHALLAGAKLVLTSQAHYLYTQRIGGISRNPSTLSRTINSFDVMRDYTLQLLDHPVVAESGSLSTLVHRRAVGIRWHQSWEKVYPALQRRELKGVLGASLRDWRIAPMIAEDVLRRIASRFFLNSDSYRYRRHRCHGIQGLSSLDPVDGGSQ